ncbi:hypothetical protein CEXT_803201 [Caerostris extrusa]|uniref:Uncharacterized protein n=1 Tax=Caerostris extrusa TaxID=172846 RepID=A0AAV4V6I1_CAEEX|nr:hypothetical protein CEXT_803201 [Caerostris extrusa]
MCVPTLVILVSCEMPVSFFVATQLDCNFRFLLQNPPIKGKKIFKARKSGSQFLCDLDNTDSNLTEQITFLTFLPPKTKSPVRHDYLIYSIGSLF